MTQETKHTPAPWIALEGDYGWQIHSDKSRWIANIKCESCPAHEEANANLIAAAPELLEALEMALELEDFECHGYAGETVAKKARQAIAKARGE